MSVSRDKIIEAATQEMRIGAPVHAADGEEVGTVKEISGAYVKVDAPMRPDFWLSAEYMLPDEGGDIRLSFEKKDLGAYKLEGPVAADVSEDADAASAGVILSADEQLEQRISMERQLAEQRRNMAHAHPNGDDAPPDTGGTVGEPVEAELARIDPAASDRADDSSSPRRESGGSPRRESGGAPAAADTVSMYGELSEQPGRGRRLAKTLVPIGGGIALFALFAVLMRRRR